MQNAASGKPGDISNGPGAKSNAVRLNLTEEALLQRALERGEGDLGKGGSLLVRTGRHTGRSPKDKFVVSTPDVDGHIWLEGNELMSLASFDRLHSDILDYSAGQEMFEQHLFGGADESCRIGVRIVCELAWHGLFARHMFRRPSCKELGHVPSQYTVINCPGFLADPDRHGCRSETVIAMNFEKRIVLIAGTAYAGETKKAVFTVLNYILPDLGILPMHCSANHALGDPDDSALFFGLSGTGKTTLSSDPTRSLVGDDEHGWHDGGIFNFEGGCYAKTIDLNAKAEPEIFAATSKFGAILENVVYDQDTRVIDFTDKSLTENTRCAYPLYHVPSASETGFAGPPRHLFMLTCDAFGVLPPIARLSPAQAVYHFLSGFTSRVAGTERGIRTPEPVFSPCFGHPFLPRRPEVYGDLMRKRVSSSGARCWLINTGWTGGGYGSGRRMPIKVTRALLNAALKEDLDRADFTRDTNFGFEVPVDVPGVPQLILSPKRTWDDPAAHDRVARDLVRMFSSNFAQFIGLVGSEVMEAAIR